MSHIFDGSTQLTTVCAEAIGKTIICEDGVPRRVVEIVPSHRYPHMCVINEQDPDSQLGYFVHNLSLSCQLLGQPLPSEDAKQAFNRMTKALDYNEPKNRYERRMMERRFFGAPKPWWKR